MGDPIISGHARERCAEMGISTKVAKRIHRHASMILPDFSGNEERSFMYSSREPGYAIVVEAGTPRDTVVTVLIWSPDQYFTRSPA
jgi:hypothetical protein